MGMHERTVLRWLKREGDHIQADEELVEIEAAKTTQAVTAPAGGVLLRVLVAEGETIPVRTPLAVVGAPSEASAERPVPGRAPPSRELDRPPSAVGASGARRVPVTPVARK